MLWELIPLERKSMTLVELKGVSKRLKPPRILTEEEFGALLNQLDHPYRCMVLLAGCTGLRISEVMGLRCNLIDFESLVMEIREGYARSHEDEIRMFPGRIAAGSRSRNHSYEVEASVPRYEWRLGLSQPADKQTLRFRFAPEESAPECGVAGQDSGTISPSHAFGLFASSMRSDGGESATIWLQ